MKLASTTAQAAGLRVAFVAGPDSVTGWYYIKALEASGASVVAQVNRGGRLLPGVPRFSSPHFLLLGKIAFDTVVIVDAADALSIVQLAQENNKHVIVHRPFTYDGRLADQCYDTAQERELALRVGLPRRRVVGGPLGTELGALGAGATSITARGVITVGDGQRPPSWEDSLLGLAAEERLARALRLVKRGGTATLHMPRPRAGIEPSLTIAIKDGPRLRIEIERGSEPACEDLSVAGPNAKVDLLLPRSLTGHMPSTRPSAKQRLAAAQRPEHLTIADCYEAFVSSALQAIADPEGKELTVLEDRRLLAALDAIKWALMNNLSQVDFQLP